MFVLVNMLLITRFCPHFITRGIKNLQYFTLKNLTDSLLSRWHFEVKQKEK